MSFVQWSGVVTSKVHIASNRLKTLCDRPIPVHATETAQAPKDKTKICKACQRIEEEQKPFREFLK